MVGILLCFIVVPLKLRQGLELNELKHKQALIAQIPAFEARLANVNVIVTGFKLNGTILDKDHPMAVINNTFIKLDGVIGGKKLTEVKKNMVTLCDINSTNRCIELVLGK